MADVAIEVVQPFEPRYRLTHTAVARFSLFLLITFSMLMPIMSGGGENGGGSAIRQIIYLLIIGFGALGARITRNLGSIVRFPISIVILLGFCWLSMLWAIDPGTSFRRLVLTTLMFFGVFMTVKKAGFDGAYRMMTLSLLMLVAISFVTVVFVPSVGIHQLNDFDNDDLIGSWKGVFGHKNYAGAVTGFLIILLFFNLAGLRKSVRLAAIILTVLFLYKTNSKTSVGLTGVALSAGLAMALYNPRYRLIVTPLFLLGCLVTALLAWANWDLLIAPFTSEDSFTGRVQIWPPMVEFWRDNWWGAGYGSFWNIDIPNPISSYVTADSYVNLISSGHNGFMDLLVTVGPIGVFLAVMGLIIWPIVGLLQRPDIPRNRAMFIVAIFVFAAGHNMTETSLMDRDQPVHIILITTIAMLGVSSRRRVPRQFDDVATD